MFDSLEYSTHLRFKNYFDSIQCHYYQNAKQERWFGFGGEDNSGVYL